MVDFSFYCMGSLDAEWQFDLGGNDLSKCVIKLIDWMRLLVTSTTMEVYQSQELAKTVISLLMNK